MAAPSKATVSLKLLIDTKSRKVLFAEADKQFVDFLFNLLSLPIGTVIKLLTKQSMVGSLGNLYDSIENLSDTYMQPNQNKYSILNPKTPLINHVQVPLMLAGGNVTVEKEFYMCPNYHRNVADDSGVVCPKCRHSMDCVVPYVERVLPAKAGAEEGGYVKGVVVGKNGY